MNRNEFKPALMELVGYKMSAEQINQGVRHLISIITLFLVFISFFFSLHCLIKITMARLTLTNSGPIANSLIILIIPIQVQPRRTFTKTKWILYGLLNNLNPNFPFKRNIFEKLVKNFIFITKVIKINYFLKKYFFKLTIFFLVKSLKFLKHFKRKLKSKFKNLRKD